jgi:tetratricopeptide (TPR) repeat protein
MTLSPDDPEVIRLYARSLMDWGRSGEALKLFEPLLAVEPRDPRLRIEYGYLLDASGDVPGALRRYREAIRLQPDSVEPYLIAGLTTNLSVGDTDLSLRLLRRAASLGAESAGTFQWLAQIYWFLGEEQLAVKAEQELQRLGATDALQEVRAYAAMLAGRPEEARTILQRLLDKSPDDLSALLDVARLPGTPEDHRKALAYVTEWMADRPNSRGLDDAPICLNAWLGNEAAARDEMARREPVWRSRHAFGYWRYLARTDKLVRSLACVGRGDDALDELEALVKEGYNIGWREMAVDHAYDTIRGDPRFKAVSDKLKADDDAARARFHARPDLNDADIESLGM